MRSHLHVTAAVVLISRFSIPGSNDKGNCLLLFYNRETRAEYIGLLWEHSVVSFPRSLLDFLQSLDHLLFKREGDNTFLPH